MLSQERRYFSKAGCAGYSDSVSTHSTQNKTIHIMPSCQGYERLTSENAALLLVDHQTGLSNGVQDQSAPEYMTAVAGLVKLAKAFKLPTVVTTSASDGPNGPILPIITQTLPDA